MQKNEGIWHGLGQGCLISTIQVYLGRCGLVSPAWLITIKTPRLCNSVGLIAVIQKCACVCQQIEALCQVVRWTSVVGQINNIKEGDNIFLPDVIFNPSVLSWTSPICRFKNRYNFWRGHNQIRHFWLHWWSFEQVISWTLPYVLL